MTHATVRRILAGALWAAIVAIVPAAAEEGSCHARRAGAAVPDGPQDHRRTHYGEVYVRGPRQLAQDLYGHETGWVNEDNSSPRERRAGW